MTEIEKLLSESLRKLSAQHEQQLQQLSSVQQQQAEQLEQQARLIVALSQRVEQLTQLLQS